VRTGLAALVVNGVIILIAAWISPSLQVDNLGWAILYSLVVSILETVLLGLVPFGDVQLWRRLQRRMRGRTLDRSIAGKPGVIFLEIDGLSHDALLRALAAGKAPTLKRCRPFLMYPAEFDLVEQELVGAESIYRTLKHWAAATA
jgi:hypothetical protein